MPITSHIDKAKDLTVFTVTGLLSFDNALPVVKAFYEGDPTKNVLWDLSDTTDVQFTSQEVEAIVSFRPRYETKRASGKTAFLAQKDILFGLSRMFEFQSSVKQTPHSIMVFRNKDEAFKWLDEP
jgi:hypothetical protein